MSARRYNPVIPILFLGGGTGLLIAGAVLQGRIMTSPWPWVDYLLFGAAYLLAGWNVLAGALRSVVRGRMFDENFLMTVATCGAFAIHQLWEAVAVMVFYKVGEILEDFSVDKSRRSINRLLALRPDVARVRRGEALVELKPEQVAIGEEVVVRPGERVPLDGVVVAGAGLVDTSALTGEPLPRNVEPGKEVLAGFISMDGSLSLRAEKSATESSASKIISLVENSAQSKAKTERFIRSFAKVYTPLVVGAAILVAFLPPLLFKASLHDWIYRALTMLVISCPCALVISIPLGYFGGVGGTSRHGILVKGATFLDTLARVRTVVFDKTGTVTKGEFKVTAVSPRNGMSGPLLLRYAALAESRSNHPIAVSIREAYSRQVAGVGRVSEIAVSDYREVSGQGVTARVEGHDVMAGNDRLLHSLDISHDTCCIDGTAVHVAVDGTYAGYLVIGDETREGATRAVKDLRSQGVDHMVLLTGDSSEVAQRVAAELGLDEWHGDLLPADKVSHLERIMADHGIHGTTAFIGDGINDAPVLARADVGIAMGGMGADAAVETADVVLMTDSPGKIVEAICRGRRTRAIVVQNIVLALGVKGVFLALGAFGVVTIWEAVIADMGVALAAILNATRTMH